MNKLISFYNMYKKKILIILIIIILFFAGLKFINYISKMDDVLYTTSSSKSQQEISKTVISDKSMISGATINNKELSTNSSMINEFLSYCKTQDIDKAYLFLSQSCKGQLFKTKEEFKENYVKKMFENSDDLYTIENWYEYTYRIKITENILATGKENKYEKQDYITIIKENEEYKLNIGNFIKETNINKEIIFDNINIKVEKEIKYLDYIYYTLDITNNSDYDVALDNLEKATGIYLVDENGAKCYIYSHEIIEKDLLINAQSNLKVKLKFYCKNKISQNINRIVFDNIILKHNKNAEEIRKTAINIR